MKLRRTHLALALAFVSAIQSRAVESSSNALISEMNCTACHTASSQQAACLSPKVAARLNELGERMNPQWVRQHLLSPQSSMPDVLHGFAAAEREEIADALTHYLFSVSASKWQPVAPDKGAVARGESVFHRIGCVACHAPQNGAAADASSVPLPNMAEKWTLRGLKRFLLDPLASRPSGRMPAMGLTDGEAQDVAHYLLRGTKVFSPLEVAVYRGRLRGLSDLDHADVQRTVPVDAFSLTVPNVRDRLQLRFNGWLRVDVAGDYTFHLIATDGATRIALDDRWIEDENCWERDKTNAKGTLHLDAGWHSLKLDFAQRGSKPPRLRVEWEGPGIKREAIPSQRLQADRDVEPSAEKSFVVDAAKAARGKALFAELNCAACHEGKAPVKPLPTLASLNVSCGCLAEKPAASAPDFRLTKEQRAAITAALSSLNRKELAAPSAKERVAQTMTAFRCFACHKRDGLGDVSKERDTFFTSNVDGQFQIAGLDAVCEVHGSILHAQCTQPCCDEIWSLENTEIRVD
ncbi:MAG: c-type cytochrome, partial [Chloroflexota bacterium]